MPTGRISSIALLPSLAPVARAPAVLTLGSALLFFGIYTDIPLPLSTGTIPMVSALPGLLILLTWRGIWRLEFAALVLPATALFLLLSLLGYNSDSSLPLRLNATAQFGLSLVIGYVGACALLALGARRIHKFMSIFLPVFTILIAIEIVSPFKNVVTEYLSLYPRTYDFLAIATRESTMGGYRPKLFTSETSYVAMSAVIAVVAHVWSGRARSRYYTALAFTFVLAALIRSPIVLLAIPIIAATAICDRTPQRLRLGHGLVLTAACFAMGALLMVLGSSVLEARLQRVTSGADYSTTYRTYGSAVVGWRVASAHPLFGIGPGSLDPARDIIIGTQARFGAPEAAILREWRVSVNNALASSLVYFGFVGSILVAFISISFVSTNIYSSRIPVFAGICFLCVTSGAIYTPKFAATFIILVALAKFSELKWQPASQLPLSERSAFRTPSSAMPAPRNL